MARTAQPDWGYITELPSGNFRARYRTDAGAVVGLGTFPSWKSADQALQVQKARLLLHLVDAPSGESRQTVREWVTRFYNGAYLARNPARRAIELNQHLLEKHVFPYLGGKKLGDLSASDVDRWYVELGWRTGAVTRRNAYFALRAATTYAVKRKVLQENPCDVQGASADVAAERPDLPFPQWLRIVQEAPEAVQVALWTMLGTHARLGELVALKRSDIDLKTGMVTICRQVVDAKGGSIVTPTKTKSTRTIQMLATPLEKLREWLEEHPVADDEWLFNSPDGERMRRHYLQMQWAKARTAAGLPQFHLHDTRHVGLGIAEATGLGLKNVQHRAGHATTAAALRYQHKRLNADTEMAERADAALRRMMV